MLTIRSNPYIKYSITTVLGILLTIIAMYISTNIGAPAIPVASLTPSQKSACMGLAAGTYVACCIFIYSALSSPNIKEFFLRKDFNRFTIKILSIQALVTFSLMLLFKLLKMM